MKREAAAYRMGDGDMIHPACHEAYLSKTAKTAVKKQGSDPYSGIEAALHPGHPALASAKCAHCGRGFTTATAFRRGDIPLEEAIEQGLVDNQTERYTRPEKEG